MKEEDTNFGLRVIHIFCVDSSHCWIDTNRLYYGKQWKHQNGLLILYLLARQIGSSRSKRLPYHDCVLANLHVVTNATGERRNCTFPGQDEIAIYVCIYCVCVCLCVWEKCQLSIVSIGFDRSLSMINHNRPPIDDGTVMEPWSINYIEASPLFN